MNSDETPRAVEQSDAIIGREIAARSKSTGTTSFVVLDDPSKADAAAAKLAGC